MFDTETMAELCVRQGLTDQAIGIFRRLAEAAGDAGVRLRYETRISELAQDPAAAPLETPGLRVTAREAGVEIEWRLPPDVPSPTLQVLLLRRGPDGIETEPRTLPLAGAEGRTSLPAPNLCGVRAAAGRLCEGAFVPLVRYPDRIA
ncbi:MAG TPA: hypothetical protein VHO06_26475 [Polyangia bacterium]|nr:hypothetical protein [Polyangia bacterium]